MSLNGLDDPKVKEAHDAAVSEPGGWFLLKYASRDEIDILGRGNGGIVEIRNAISEYEETSPLYGFLRYRRRSVIIKYLPEGCSRLIQARVTVHFNAVCERFSPHDTTFSITTASELKDTKLSAACSLHAASGSTSSSTSSLRRRRLVEIAEEDEEEQQRATKRQSLGEIDAPDAPAAPTDQPAEETQNSAPNLEPPVVLDAELAASPEKGNFTNATDPPDFMGAPRPPSPAKSFDTASRRMSSQSTRPDYYSYASYGRQKVKLGPRPSLDVSGRPQTATGGTFRPVSTIPAGFKLFSKGSRKGKSKDSADNDGSSSSPEQQHAVPEISFDSSIVPIPEPPESPDVEEPRRPHTSSGPRPSTSSGASFVMPPFKPTTPVKEKMTPEKARLMKAMQLREKKKKMSMMMPPPVPSIPPSAQIPRDEMVETGELSPKLAIPEEAMERKPEVEEGDQDDKLSLSQADSAIVMEASMSAANDQASEATQTDSHPASPFIASSEAAQSTKASSFSESTDETVQATHGKEEEEEDDDDEGNHADAEDSIIISNDRREDSSIALGEDNTENAPLPEAEPIISEKPDALIVADDQSASTANEHQDTELESATGSPPRTRVNKALPVSKFATAKTPDNTHSDEVATEKDSTEEETAGEVVDVRQERRRSSLKIPMSKFSTHDLEPDDVPPVPVLSMPEVAESQVTEQGAEQGLEVKDGNQLQHTKGQDRTSVHSRLSRKTANLDPINTDLTASNRGSHDLSDDDELLNELQSATVEEAKPITVSKSPLTPIFPAMVGRDGAPAGVRTVSQPNNLRGSSLLSPKDLPPPPSARSISSGAAFLQKITQQQTQASSLAPKKANIGSSISQRIKALEKLSGGGGAAPVLDPIEPRRPKTPSANFFSVRKSTVREPSRSPSVAERATSFTKGSPPPNTKESPPETSRQRSRERSASLANRLTMFESGGAPPPLPQSRGRTESIQVRARIVRDPSLPVGAMPDHKNSAEYAPLELKQSPLIVDHKKAEPELPMRAANPVPVAAPKETIQERRMSKEKRRSESNDRSGEAEQPTKARRSSLSIVKDFIKERRKSLTSPSVDNLMAPTPSTPSRSPSRPPSVHQNSSFPRRLSISSRRSSVSKDPGTAGTLSPSAFTETSGSGDESKSGTSEKKSKSRAGRFMRRLSSSLHGSRGKNTPTGISPTLHEEVSAEAINSRPAQPKENTGPTIVAYMGDVNVQFPDNLLWKRRSMCLDSQGFLILSATGATAAPMDKQPSGVGVKRYHLSEFRVPYPPEMEVQELPNSVVLDFIEGSGLQVACEDRAGQMHILQILVDAHKNHSSFGQ